jgi:glycosyltransferase involved in cell wall biosynthesis
MHVLFTYLEDVASSPPGHSLSREVSEASASLAHLGVQVTILTPSSEQEGSQQLVGNPRRLLVPLLRVIPLARLKEMRQQALLQCNLSLLAQMASLQGEGRRIDLVHCFGWQAGLASGLISQMTRAPLVCTIEDDMAERAPGMVDPQMAYPRCVERWLIRHSRRLICPDSYARNKIQDLFLVKEEDVCVVSPVPTRLHRRGGKSMGPPKGEASILYLGSLDPESGVVDLLWACSRLVARGRLHLRLLLAASAGPPYDLLIRKMIRKLQLAEHVSFLNHIDRGRPHQEFFQQAHLLVMPGRAEFVGNLVLAAMDNGLPIVAANCGALAQLLEHGVNGLKFPCGQGRALVEAMEAVLLDPQLYRRLALGARREVRRRPEVGSLLLNMYQGLRTSSGEN